MGKVLVKRAAEQRTFDIDASGDLADDETIASVSTLASEPAGLSFGAAVVNGAAVTYRDGYTAAIGTVVQARISGGTAGQQYLVRATYTTSRGDTTESVVALEVRS